MVAVFQSIKTGSICAVHVLGLRDLAPWLTAALTDWSRVVGWRRNTEALLKPRRTARPRPASSSQCHRSTVLLGPGASSLSRTALSVTVATCPLLGHGHLHAAPASGVCAVFAVSLGNISVKPKVTGTKQKTAQKQKIYGHARCAPAIETSSSLKLIEHNL